MGKKRDDALLDRKREEKQVRDALLDRKREEKQVRLAFNNPDKELWGFDDNRCTRGRLITGGLTSLHPVSSEWECAVCCAKFAAAKQAEDGGTPIGFDLLLKVNIRPATGIMYYLTFTAFENVDMTGQLKLYRARVWARVDNPVSLYLLFFEEFKDSKIAAEKMRKDVSRLLKKVEKFKSRRPTRQFVYDYRRSDDRSGVVFHRPKRGQLQAMGFLFLLKEIRNENPRWKYARVRKAASKRWKSMSFSDKLPYVIEAEEKLKKMCPV